MKILGIGTTVVDRIVVMDSYPDVNTKKEISHSWHQVGGPVPVALSTAAARGTKVRLLGRWGNDSDGRYLSETLSARHFDLRFTKTADNWQSGNAQVWISQNDGSRTIAFSRGVFPPLTSSDITDEVLDDCNILHLDGWAADAAIAAAMKMKQQNGTVVLDAGSVKPKLDQLLPYVDVLIASQLFQDAFWTARQTEDELCEGTPADGLVSQRSNPKKETTKTATDANWATLGIPTVITTHGEQGATLHTKDGTFIVDSHKVDCVDSNGAGDIFSGAVLHGLVQEWPMRKTVEFANVIAAKSCTQFGNTPCEP